MVIKEQNYLEAYPKRRDILLNDESICLENRKLFEKFFIFQERKLKRINDMAKIDNGSAQTCYKYVVRFRNINKWFNNKPLKNLTREDITRVYDQLEDGIIVTNAGKPLAKAGRQDYYSKVFKSKLFKMIGKDAISRDVMEYTKASHSQEVRFISEDDFKKLINMSSNPQHKLLLWLAWDIGENISSLLKLTKNDCYRQFNKYTKEPEYRINLRKEILKRSRRARAEITNYRETTELLDKHLIDIEDDGLLFEYGYRNAKKIIERAVEKTKIKCIPAGEKPSFKDLRSGMACNLLKKGWSVDEINSRLGHRPSSPVIDKYINFLATERSEPKKKVRQYDLQKLEHELSESKDREKLQNQRFEDMNETMKLQQEEIIKMKETFKGLAENEMIQGIMQSLKLMKKDGLKSSDEVKVRLIHNKT